MQLKTGEFSQWCWLSETLAALMPTVFLSLYGDHLSDVSGIIYKKQR
jgi:hypothetical protein